MRLLAVKLLQVASQPGSTLQLVTTSGIHPKCVPPGIGLGICGFIVDWKPTLTYATLHVYNASGGAAVAVMDGSGEEQLSLADPVCQDFVGHLHHQASDLRKGLKKILKTLTGYSKGLSSKTHSCASMDGSSATHTYVYTRGHQQPFLDKPFSHHSVTASW